MQIAGFIEKFPEVSEQEKIICVLHNLSFFSLFSSLLEIYGNDDLSKHTSEVADILLSFAQFLGLPKERQQKLYIQGLMHDTGKLGVDWSVLKKPGDLTEAELQSMRMHTILGQEFLKNLSFSDSLGITETAYAHHENLNGTGYPCGKRSAEISEDVRMVSIVDRFQALTAIRVYKNAKSPENAMLILEDQSFSGLLDKDLTRAFTHWVELGMPKPDYSVLEIPYEYITSKSFQELSQQYRQEIILLLNKIIAKSPNGYNTEVLSALSNAVSQILQLKEEDTRLLNISTILSGIGNLAKIIDPDVILTEDVFIRNRRIVVENTMYLLNKSMWLQDVASIAPYMYAYYDGNEAKSVYASEKRVGATIPYLSRVLAIIATLFSRESSDPFDYVLSERGLRYDPDIVDLLIMHKAELSRYCAYFRKQS